MLKLVAWSSALAATGAVTLFLPIDPAILNAVGLHDGAQTRFAQEAVRSGTVPIARDLATPIASGATVSDTKLTSRMPTSRMEVRVVRAPTVSPYSVSRTQTASVNDTPITPPRPFEVQRLAITPAARVPSFAQPPVRPSPANAGALASRLQTELRRVGCYTGRIDGDWGPASRFAMAKFTRSVNAALPTAEPDEILLSLVRRHAGFACGQAHEPRTITAQVPVRRTLVRESGGNRTVAQAGSAGWAKRTARRTASSAAAPPRLMAAPRIVRIYGNRSGIRSTTVAASSNGYDASTFGSQNVAAAGAQPGTNARFDVPRMSLGVAPPQTNATAPVTRSSSRRARSGRSATRQSYRNRRIRPRRAKRARNRYRSVRRARSRRWRNKVLHSVDLGGS